MKRNLTGRKSNRHKTKVGLPDLEHAKAAVLVSLRSPESQRSYRRSIDDFVRWYCSEPRLSLNKTVVTRFRIHLEDLQLAPGTVNVRLAAVRRLAYEAAQLGGAHCIALNAADEVAVEAFLAGDIHFTDIPRTIEAVLQATSESHPGAIEDVLALDEHAREVSRTWLARSSLTGAGASKLDNWAR